MEGSGGLKPFKRVGDVLHAMGFLPCDENDAGAEEELGIEELILQARQKAAIGISSSDASENMLLQRETRRLARMVATISRISPLQGAGDELGFMRPDRALALTFQNQHASCVEMSVLDRACDSAEQAGLLWEGQPVMSGLPLARNALVYAVLDDDDLREAAFRRAEETLERWAESFELYNQNLEHPNP